MMGVSFLLGGRAASPLLVKLGTIETHGHGIFVPPLVCHETKATLAYCPYIWHQRVSGTVRQYPKSWEITGIPFITVRERS